MCQCQRLSFEVEPFQRLDEFNEFDEFDELDEFDSETGNPPAPPANALPPQMIQTAAQSAGWRARVDSAIRGFFKLTGVGLAGRVRFVTEAQYPNQFPAAMLRGLLLNLFMDEPTAGPIASIIRHHKMDDRLQGFRDEKLMRNRVADLQKFIDARIRIGSFEHKVFAPPVPSKSTITPQIIKLTPRRLAAEMIAGFTISQPVRANSVVVMPLPNAVETLVHEGCHFYAHNNFTVEARRHGTEFFQGLRVSQLLIEGFCEFFSRQVMQANQGTLGPSDLSAYQGYVAATNRLLVTEDEQVMRDAYFKGNAAAIKHVLASIKAYPLMVP